MTINFKHKITTQRPSGSAAATETPDAILRAFESDRGRIIQSAAVRRLQQKTQVFPLERNAAVRSRLTHSLEVQQTGRFIVRTLIQKLGSDVAKLGLEPPYEQALETLVEMSCLMHDIGNPPFGHFGEAAIQNWFAQNIKELFGHLDNSYQHHDLLQQDLIHFEGNAQAIRLTATLLRLNLTYSQTAGLMKYTRPAYEPKPNDCYRAKKPGYYYSEQKLIGDLQQALDIQPGCRHPLAYIMEAADDISYCLADIEDAVEKNILDLSQLTQLLKQQFEQISANLPSSATNNIRTHDGNKVTFESLIDQANKAADSEPVDPVGQYFIALRVALIHPLVEHAASQCAENMEAVFHGTLDRALLEDGSVYQHVISTLKEVAFEHVFNHPEVETLELQGYQIIHGLLNFYAPLLKLSSSDFASVLDGSAKHMILPKRLAKRLPAKHIAAYLQQPKSNEHHELYYRCRLIQDFISGMTDQFAIDEYQTLAVIR